MTDLTQELDRLHDLRTHTCDAFNAAVDQGLDSSADRLSKEIDAIEYAIERTEHQMAARAAYEPRSIVQVICLMLPSGLYKKAVLITGAVNDVAAYCKIGIDADSIPPEAIARKGNKMFEDDALAFGFNIPEGHHYRR